LVSSLKDEEWKKEVFMNVFSRGGKGLATMASLALLIVLLAACGAGGGAPAGGGSTGSSSSGGSTGAANGKGCTKVGVLMPDSASSDRWESKDHPLLVKSIGAVLGTTVHVDYDNAQGNSATQLSQAEADLTKGDCILVVAANDSGEAAAIVAKAHAQNVPVIAYDRLIQSKDLAYYVSFDNVKVGELQGQYIADHYKDFVSSGHSNVSLINGSQTDNNALLFSKGVHNKIDPLFASKALKKVYEQFTPNWTPATAQTEMEAALTANHNDIQIAYAANDDMANASIAALKAQHLNGKVLVTGQDATGTGIHNILAGDQAMTAYKAIAKEAQATADLVKALSQSTDPASLINGSVETSDGTAIKSVLETPVAVDKTNIATTVIADGYVTKADVCQGIPAGTDGVC
jgi:D-xylose transport system substrate-binding protein